MISKIDINRIAEATDIVQLVSEKVELNTNERRINQ